MRIVGLDPALASLGHAVLWCNPENPADVELVEYGTLETPPHRPEGERLLLIKRWLESYLESRRPTIVVLERPMFRGHLAYNSLPLGMAYGVIAVVCEAAALRVQEYAPNTVKLLACGKGLGRASKAQVRAAMRTRFGHAMKGKDDGVDAVAIALAHAKRLEEDKPVIWRTSHG